jgi:hypothetical protein
MNLAELTRYAGELRKASGDRLTSDVKSLINRAQRKICEKNWGFMRDTLDVTILAGATSGELAQNFKELTPERHPVSFTDSTTTANCAMPVRVYSREEMQRRGWWPMRNWVAGTSTYLPGFGVYIDQSQGVSTLNIPQNLASSTDLTFTVSAFYYPEELVKASDHNPLTDHGDLQDALLNLAKAYAYEAEDPTNPAGQACRLLYASAVRTAEYNDVRKTYAGRTLAG